MASEFDAIKSLKEEIAGLSQVSLSLARRARSVEAQLGEAEAELNNLRQITGFASAELARKRAVLLELEMKKEAQDKTQ